MLVQGFKHSWVCLLIPPLNISFWDSLIFFQKTLWHQIVVKSFVIVLYEKCLINLLLFTAVYLLYNLLRYPVFKYVFFFFQFTILPYAASFSAISLPAVITVYAVFHDIHKNKLCKLSICFYSNNRNYIKVGSISYKTCQQSVCLWSTQITTIQKKKKKSKQTTKNPTSNNCWSWSIHP